MMENPPDKTDTPLSARSLLSVSTQIRNTLERLRQERIDRSYEIIYELDEINTALPLDLRDYIYACRENSELIDLEYFAKQDGSFDQPSLDTALAIYRTAGVASEISRLLHHEFRPSAKRLRDKSLLALDLSEKRIAPEVIIALQVYLEDIEITQ